MVVDIAIQTSPLHLDEYDLPGAGTVVRFEGKVRPQENGKLIEALVYEAYEPMAQEKMKEILLELTGALPCIAARVRHRIGEVPVGEAAILVEVISTHRAEAFLLASAFMDRLKQDVPIWKIGSRSGVAQ